MSSDSHNRPAIVQSTRWYDLFSRGARDWLRHNEKVRESVRESLPELISGPDVLTQPENRTVKVPIKFLEHYRFRLSDSDTQTGVAVATAVRVPEKAVSNSSWSSKSMKSSTGCGKSWNSPISSRKPPAA
jgi:uncharacterized sporulation protein YeaH/YhbH (DUF444 family)